MDATKDVPKKLPGGYHVATITQFEQARIAAGHTQRTGAHEAFLHQLLNEHVERQSPNIKVGDVYTALQLTEDHARALESLLASTGMTRTDFLRRLLLKEIDAHHRRTTRLYDLDLTDPENRSRRAGAADQYLRQVVERLIVHNTHASDESDRVYITTDALEKASGSARKLCSRFLRDHAALIQEHHEAMGWPTVDVGRQHNLSVGLRKREEARKARKRARQAEATFADIFDVMHEEVDEAHAENVLKA